MSSIESQILGCPKRATGQCCGTEHLWERADFEASKRERVVELELATVPADTVTLRVYSEKPLRPIDATTRTWITQLPSVNPDLSVFHGNEAQLTSVGQQRLKEVITPPPSIGTKKAVDCPLKDVISTNGTTT